MVLVEFVVVVLVVLVVFVVLVVLISFVTFVVDATHVALVKVKLVPQEIQAELVQFIQLLLQLEQTLGLIEILQ